MSKLQRTACVLVAVFVLALPLAAQTPGEERTTWMERLLSVVWERFATPFASLRAEATAEPKGLPADSTGSTTADDGDDDSDGRAHIDPNG
jgi:hypothetical protein